MGFKVVSIWGSGNQPLTIVDVVGPEAVKVQGRSGWTSTLLITDIRPYSPSADTTTDTDPTICGSNSSRKPAPKKGRKTIGKSRRHGTDNNKAIAAVATSFKMKKGDYVVFNGNRFTVLENPRGKYVMAKSMLSGFSGKLEISKIKPYTG